MANGNGNGKNGRNYLEWSKDELIKGNWSTQKTKNLRSCLGKRKNKRSIWLFHKLGWWKNKELFPESQNKFPVLKEIKSKEINGP